jgi:hypothetical protein
MRDQVLLGAAFRGGTRRVHVLSRHLLLARDASSIAAPAIDGQAPCHAYEPGAEAISVSQLREHPVGPDEGLLRDVLGVLAVSEDGERDTKRQGCRFHEAGFEFLLERSIHGREGA